MRETIEYDAETVIIFGTTLAFWVAVALF